MDIHTNIPLKNFTTMKIGGPARFFTEVRTAEEVQAVYQNAKSKQIPVFVLGGGSNLIVRDEGFNGLIMRVRNTGFDVIADDPSSTTIKIGAGEIWDDIVKKSVEIGLSGIEAMSGIPGTVGATPVQNVGAYGQEVSDTLVSLEAYDTINNAFVTLTNEQCGFSYRHSIFRGQEMGRYIITSVTLKLYKTQPKPPFYAALQDYLDANNITLYTHQIIRDAVLKVRESKLPPVEQKPSAGSFFKNAIIEDWQYKPIKEAHPDMPSYEMGDGTYKIPTGWLIEKTGLKGKLLSGMRVHEGNALVLVNESATGYADLAAARDEIKRQVQEMFQITIEQEPLELGS